MEKYIYNEQNGLHYELVGDYYLPLLTVPETPPLGIWGRSRNLYLKEHRPVIYNTMLLSGDLFSHRSAGQGSARQADEADGSTGRDHRAAQSTGSNGMGTADECYRCPGPGDHQRRTHLRIISTQSQL